MMVIIWSEFACNLLMTGGDDGNEMLWSLVCCDGDDLVFVSDAVDPQDWFFRTSHEL